MRASQFQHQFAGIAIWLIVFHCFTHKKCSPDIFYFAQSFVCKRFGESGGKGRNVSRRQDAAGGPEQSEG